MMMGGRMLKIGKLRRGLLVLLLGLLPACGQEGATPLEPTPEAAAVVKVTATIVAATQANPPAAATPTPTTPTDTPAPSPTHTLEATVTPTGVPPEATATPAPPAAEPSLQEYPVPGNAQPHDVAPAPDGTVWY